MEIKLAQNEQIIKSWDYAIAGATLAKKSKKFKHNLTVTNFRVIWSSYNDIALNRKEILIKDITSIDGSYSRNRCFWAKVRLVLGIPLCLIIVGIPIVKNALAVIRGTKFELTLQTGVRPGEDLSIGKTAGVSTKTTFFGRLFRKTLKEFSVTVDRANAVEIINEIGAIVQDAK